MSKKNAPLKRKPCSRSYELAWLSVDNVEANRKRTTKKKRAKQDEKERPDVDHKQQHTDNRSRGASSV